MDGEHKGKPYEQMDDLGVFPYFLETPICQDGKLGQVYVYPGSRPASIFQKSGGSFWMMINPY